MDLQYFVFNLFQQKYGDMMDRYKELLTYIKVCLFLFNCYHNLLDILGKDKIQSIRGSLLILT